MTQLWPLDLLLLFAETSTFSWYRFTPQFVAGVIAVLSLVLVEVHVRRLNLRYAKLLADLNTEFAERLKAEEARRATEGFYHSLVESLPPAFSAKTSTAGSHLATTASRRRWVPRSPTALWD